MGDLRGEYIPRLISKMPNPIGIQIGSDETTTAYLLKSVPSLKLHNNVGLTDFADHSVDFIFMNETYTLNDMTNYYPKLKNGGLFCGYGYRNVPEVTFVTEFASNLNKRIDYDPTQDVWYWYKD